MPILFSLLILLICDRHIQYMSESDTGLIQFFIHVWRMEDGPVMKNFACFGVCLIIDALVIVTVSLLSKQPITNISFSTYCTVHMLPNLEKR